MSLRTEEIGPDLRKAFNQQLILFKSFLDQLHTSLLADVDVAVSELDACEQHLSQLIRLCKQSLLIELTSYSEHVASGAYRSETGPLVCLNSQDNQYRTLTMMSVQNFEQYLTGQEVEGDRDSHGLLMYASNSGPPFAATSCDTAHTVHPSNLLLNNGPRLPIMSSQDNSSASTTPGAGSVAQPQLQFAYTHSFPEELRDPELGQPGTPSGKRRKRTRPVVDDQLYSKVSSRLSEESKHEARRVCTFYMAIGSIEAFSQLEEIVRHIREAEGWRFMHDASSMTKTVESLDRLDNSGRATAFLRRVLLLRLATHYEASMRSLTSVRESTSNTGMLKGGGRLESTTLDQLMMQAYPSIRHPPLTTKRRTWRTDYAKERKSLHNRLTAARKWRYAVDVFDVGIVAIVPTGGTLGVQNQSYETLHDESCKLLMLLLEEKDQGFIAKASAHLTPFVEDVQDGTLPMRPIDVGDVRALNSGLPICLRASR